VATELARASAAIYEQLHTGGHAGFDRVGGLEVACTATAMNDLLRRAALAQTAGLTARVLDAAETVALAPQLINPDRCIGGVLYPADGTARAEVITTALKAKAEAAGARFRYDTTVTGIDVGGSSVRGVAAGGSVYPADNIAIACGVWGPAIAALAGEQLPLTAVAHPYVYGPSRPAAIARRPFVRWPEHHVYARDHGNRLGLGTYDHQPFEVAANQLGAHAEQAWPGRLFNSAVTAALNLLPVESRFTPDQQLNGIFAMTADNLPLVGPVGDIQGLWAAEALWVTHAAGAAQALAQLITGNEPTLPGHRHLDPSRFAGQPATDLTDRALRLYRDIYTTATA
jgi:glycine/D-amino acid oxidase-like deaminating enzyme